MAVFAVTLAGAKMKSVNCSGDAFGGVTCLMGRVRSAIGVSNRCIGTEKGRSLPLRGQRSNSSSAIEP